MSEYHDGLNVDRLVTFAALVSFIKIQESNRGYKRVVEEQEGKDLEKSQNLFKLKKSPFSNIGPNRKRKGRPKRGNGFKNLK